MVQSPTNFGQEAFGKALRGYRVAAGLTQQRLAERAGWSVHGISDLERGARRYPYPDTVQRLADALKLTDVDRVALVAASRRSPIRHKGVVSSYPPTAGSLPAPLSSFIGQESEVAELVQLLGRQRLVTLVGIGGIGKTRLAIRVASETGPTFRDGVRFVDLARVVNPASLHQAVASALGVTDQARRPLVETIVDNLRVRTMLLVLDNCEHLLSSCALLVELLLERCPRLTVLATSRERLGVTGEIVWRVPSLLVADTQRPADTRELMQIPSVALFVERASPWNRLFG